MKTENDLILEELPNLRDYLRYLPQDRQGSRYIVSTPTIRLVEIARDELLSRGVFWSFGGDQRYFLCDKNMMRVCCVGIVHPKPPAKPRGFFERLFAPPSVSPEPERISECIGDALHRIGPHASMVKFVAHTFINMSSGGFKGPYHYYPHITVYKYVHDDAALQAWVSAEESRRTALRNEAARRQEQTANEEREKAQAFITRIRQK